VKRPGSRHRASGAGRLGKTGYRVIRKPGSVKRCVPGKTQDFTTDGGLWTKIRRIIIMFKEIGTVTRFLAITAVLMVVMPLGLLAQAPPPAGRWWHIPKVAEELNLRDDQKSRLDSLYLANRSRIIDLKAKMQKEQIKLEGLLEKQKLDKAAVMKQYDRVEKARSALARERFRYLLQVREIIGYDRFENLKVLFSQWRMKRKMGGGRGMTGHMPGERAPGGFE